MEPTKNRFLPRATTDVVLASIEQKTNPFVCMRRCKEPRWASLWPSSPSQRWAIYNYTFGTPFGRSIFALLYWVFIRASRFFFVGHYMCVHLFLIRMNLSDGLMHSPFLVKLCSTKEASFERRLGLDHGEMGSKMLMLDEVWVTVMFFVSFHL